MSDQSPPVVHQKTARYTAQCGDAKFSMETFDDGEIHISIGPYVSAFVPEAPESMLVVIEKILSHADPCISGRFANTLKRVKL